MPSTVPTPGSQATRASAPNRPPSALRGQRNHLIQLFEQTKDGQSAKIEAERAFGSEWNTVKNKIKTDPGMTIKQYVSDNGLPFSHTYANGCGRLASNFSAFELAHAWHGLNGLANGWRTKRNAGWEYALEVITLHREALAGKLPDRTNAARPINAVSSTAIIKGLRQERDDRAKDASMLLDELEHVCSLYTRTREGADYICTLLYAARGARERQASAVLAASASTEVSQTGCNPGINLAQTVERRSRLVRKAPLRAAA